MGDHRYHPVECQQPLSAGGSNAPPCGVSVPSFLQALLGIDFVPYHCETDKRLDDLPDYGKSESAEDTLPSSFDQDVLSVLGLALLEEDVEDCSKANIRTTEEEIFRPFGDDVVTVEAEIHVHSGQNKKNRAPRRMSSLIHSLRKRRVKTPSSGSTNAIGSSAKAATRRIQSSQSMPCEYDISYDSTPQRKGCEAAWGAKECSCLESIQAQHCILQKHQERLLKAQKEAVIVKRQAGEIEDRLLELQKQTLGMKRALDLSILKLNQETMALQTAKEHISNLDQEAEDALRCLEESLKVLRPRSISEDLSADPTSPFREKPTRMNRPRASTDNDLCMEETKARVPASPPLLLSSALSTKFEKMPPRSRANTAPTRPLSACSSFMRINDLACARDFRSDSSSLSTAAAVFTCNDGEHVCEPSGAFMDEDFFFVDHNLSLLLDKLFELGYNVATDESDRFEPTRDTKYLLQKRKNSTVGMESDWPVQPWHAATGGSDVFTWIGGVDHVDFGHDWPVVKARGIVETSPRALLDFLLDPTQVQRYNKISQGREDVLVLQEGVDTTADESDYGLVGDAKIVRSLVKPKLLPKSIEMLSLWYSKPIPNAPPGSYMIVNRSVWEHDHPVVTSCKSPKQNNSDRLRSEMLLGVQLLRPVRGGRHCELTTITHVFSPGVPEMMAKRFAPNNATAMLREIQEIFR